MATSDDKATVDALPRSRDPAAREPPPELPARYASGEEIARGGMGRVLEATDTLLGRVVAVKEALSTDPEALRRFQRETNLTARLEHPSIVPVYDAGTTPDGSPYYVMRKVSGRPLEELVGDAKLLDQRLALLPHVLAAAQAVAHAHGRGILHRDLKPSNILVGDLGETVVIDWGLAKVVAEPMDLLVSGPTRPGVVPARDSDDQLQTQYGTVIGTPGFMAAEQLRGEPAQRQSDVYALGATLYYLLARRPPHSAETGEAMMAMAAKGPPKPIAELAEGTPPELATIVDKALAFRPADRYPDAGALAEDLRRFLAGQLVASHRYSARERLVRFGRKHRAVVAVVTLAAIALAIGSIVAFRRVVSERDRADASAQLAMQRQRDAEGAEARERDRAEQLFLTQARTLVATNPTAAVAMLKDLAKQPERWAKSWRHARAIAADARIAGVARGYPGVKRPIALAMSASGDRALLCGEDGVLHVYFLATQTHRKVATTGDFRNCAFVGDRHVVMFRDQQLAIFDLETGARLDRELPVTIASHDTGLDALYWRDSTSRLWRLRIPDGQPELVYDRPVSDLHVSPDRKLLLVNSPQSLAVLDLATFRVVHEPGRGGAAMVAWGPTSKDVVARYDDAIERIDLATGKIRSYPARSPYVLLLPLSENLVAFSMLGGLERIVDRELRPFYVGDFDIGRGAVRAQGDYVIGSAGSRLLVFDGMRVLEVATPVETLRRVAASPNSRYVIAASPGQLLVWEIDDIVTPPTSIADRVASYALLGEHDVLIYTVDAEWQWLDRRTGARTTIMKGALMSTVVSNATSTSALGIMTSGGAVLIAKPGTIVEQLEDVELGVFHHDSRLLLGTQNAAVLYDPATRRRTTLYSRHSELAALAWEGAWVAALYRDGTLWRRNLASNAESEIAIPVREQSRFTLRLLEDGTIYVPVETTVRRWEPGGAVVQHVTLPHDVDGIVASNQRMLVSTVDGASYLVSVLDQKIIGMTPAGASLSAIALDVNLGIFQSSSKTPVIVDLEVGLQWPVMRRTQGMAIAYPAIATTGRTVAAIYRAKLVTWQVDVPDTAEATKDWLYQLTNASAEMGPTTVTWQ